MSTLRLTVLSTSILPRPARMQLVYLVFGTNIQNHLMQVIDQAALRYWEGEHPRRLWPPQDVEYRG